VCLYRSNRGVPSNKISAITQPALKISIDGASLPPYALAGGDIHLSGAK